MIYTHDVVMCGRMLLYIYRERERERSVYVS